MASVKPISLPEARAKIYRYCAYQERCHNEVRSKLFEYGLTRNDVEELITDLITEGYLNEERFARSYAGGKFRMKKWGRVRITRELEARDISPYCIRMALSEVEDDDYLNTLRELLSKKAAQVDEENIFVKRDKVATYAIQKGFEPDLVWTTVREVIG
mgnify:FL=1|jgi:Uncharacterized protein conserved in bacteria